MKILKQVASVKATKNNMHTHLKCNHKLKYCEQCDTVYCEKCSREWKKETINFTYTQPGTSTWPNQNMFLCGGSEIANNCTHKII